MTVRTVYQRVYQRSYTPGQKVAGMLIDARRSLSPASGCKGLSSLRSSTPCPSAFPGPTARSSLVRDASLSRKGKGCAPAPSACGPTAAAAKLSPSILCVRPFRLLHATQGSVCSRCSGASSDALFAFPFVPMQKPFRLSVWFDVVVITMAIVAAIQYRMQ